MKNELFLLENENFQVVQNTTGYHPGQVLPSRADEAPLVSAVSNIKQSQRPFELAYLVSFNLHRTAATVCRKFATQSHISHWRHKLFLWMMVSNCNNSAEKNCNCHHLSLILARKLASSASNLDQKGSFQLTILSYDAFWTCRVFHKKLLI